MSVDSIGAFANQTAAAAAAVAANQSSSGAAGGGLPQISQSDFLQLITAQLQDQDPTQPADPNQMLNELASLSEVSGMNNMNGAISNLSTSMQSSQLLSGTNLIGHGVLAAGTTAALAAGGKVTGALQPPTGATALAVQVTDSTGQLVRTFQVTPQSSGLTSFSWDGTTNSGTAAPAGTYTFAAAAVSAGAQVSVPTYLQSTVNSVTIDPSSQTLSLNTNSGTLSLSDVVQVN
jgi:flagellar basal-body rod modification protein FlgD